MSCWAVVIHLHNFSDGGHLAWTKLTVCLKNYIVVEVGYWSVCLSSRDIVKHQKLITFRNDVTLSKLYRVSRYYWRQYLYTPFWLISPFPFAIIPGVYQDPLLTDAAFNSGCAKHAENAQNLKVIGSSTFCLHDRSRSDIPADVRSTPALLQCLIVCQYSISVALWEQCAVGYIDIY
jgi:hypothetical protein